MSRFNIKMSFYQYRKSHCGDKTVVRSSYLHNEISYTGKMTSSYWIRALGLYSLNGRTPYHKISRSLEAARFGFKLFQSLWNLAGISAAALPRCLSNYRAIRPLQHPISRLRDFTRFGGKTSYRLVNRGPALCTVYMHLCREYRKISNRRRTKSQN